jgi:hypothetical protein
MASGESLSLVCASVVVARGGGGVRVILLADFLPARWDGRALVVSPRSLCASSNPNIHPQARLMELNYPPEWGERQIARLHVPCCIYKCALRTNLLYRRAVLCARLIHDRKKSCLTEIANKTGRTETARRRPPHRHTTLSVRLLV